MKPFSQLFRAAAGLTLAVALDGSTGAHAAPAQAPSQARDATLWVTLGESEFLVEVDPYTFIESRRIKVDPKPHGLVASADGTKLYITSDKTGNLQIVDVKSGMVTGQVNVGKDPNQLTLTKDEKFAYVPVRGDNRIAVVQLSPLKVVKYLPSPAGPHDAYTSEDGTRVYVGAQFGGGIVVIDPAKQEVLHVIPTTAGVRPIRPSKDGKTLYVALSKLVGFVMVDPATQKVTRRVELGTLPEGIPMPYRETWTHDLALANNESELWLCDDANNLIRVVRLADMKETHQIKTGAFPHWFAMRPDGRVLFASIWYSDAVTAYDVNTKKAIATMQFGLDDGPKRIAIARKVR
jgi:YVTN family beta-propeller protein